MNDLNRLLQRLSEADIDFVIVGGFAAMLHGSTLLTRDLDICAVLTGENVGKLREALRDLKPVHRQNLQKLSFLDRSISDEGWKNLYLKTEWGAVDILSSISGVGDYERVRETSLQIDFFGRSCRVISLPDLIAAKQAIGREKDLLAVKELLSIAEKQRDTGSVSE